MGPSLFNAHFLCFQVSRLQLNNFHLCPVIKPIKGKIRVIPLLLTPPFLSYTTAQCPDPPEDCSTCTYVGFAFMSFNVSSFSTKDSREDAKGSEVPQASSNCGHMWDCWCYIFIWKGTFRFKRSWSCPSFQRYSTTTRPLCQCCFPLWCYFLYASYLSLLLQ